MSEKETAPAEFQNFEEFWPHYVRQHQHPINRALHFVGTTLAMRQVYKAVKQRSLKPLLLAPLFGYGFAWVGHFFLERNKPASFGHPGWSLRGDFRMWNRMAQRKMGPELDHAASNP